MEQTPGTQTPVQLMFTNDAGTAIEIVSPDNPLPVDVTISPGASSTPYHLSGGTTASTNAHSVIVGAHALMALNAINTGATVGYLRLYDLAVAPTPADGTGCVWVVPIPASVTGAGVALPLPEGGIDFANGIAFVVTGGGADTDATSGPAGIFINMAYN